MMPLTHSETYALKLGRGPGRRQGTGYQPVEGLHFNLRLPCCAIIFLRTPAVRLPRCAIIFLRIYPAVPLF